MRSKGLGFFASLVLAASLGIACSSKVDRAGFGTNPANAIPVDKGFGDVADAGDSNAACASSNTEIKRVPVVIEFVVDQSSSMDTSNYWTSARDALLAAFADMHGSADPATFIGLIRYSSYVEVWVDPDSLTDQSHYDELVTKTDTPKAGGDGTQTAKALKAAYEIVEKFEPWSTTGLVIDQMKRVVVLLSDGVPENKEACEQIVAEKANGVPPLGPTLTFAVGIGEFGYSGYDPQFMGKLAQLGKTARPNCALDATDPATTCHFQVTPGEDLALTKQSLLDAINTIRALSASCEFAFELNGSSDPNNVRVVITDAEGHVTEIEKDDENGWSFDDPENPSKVVLRGAACASSSGSVAGRVDVTIGCRGAN